MKLTNTIQKKRVDALEASRSERIVKKLNALPGCKATERIPTDWNPKGEPDIFGSIRHPVHGFGVHFEFETKRPKKELEVLQRVRADQWRATGAIVARVESWEDVERILKGEGLL